MSAHRVLKDLYRAYEGVGPGVAKDPGNAGTIEFEMQGQFCPVVTAAAETRTLAQPNRPGILATVCLDTDGGNLTLTVTGGYNSSDDDTIVFNDAGDFVVFVSIKEGSSYYWRAVTQTGTDAAVDAEHGAGAIGTAAAPATYRYSVNGTIVTEIKIDLTGLDSSGTENDVIGLAAGGAAYLGRNVVATNGIIYKLEMSCLELPAGGDADIILVAGSAADEAFDDTVANSASLADAAGDWVAGETVVNNAPAITANHYLYLTLGSTDNNIYTAGQFLIRLYGHPLL